MQNKCPQCNCIVEKACCRLVQDSCGHTKCRLCLLKDKDECLLCIQQKEANKNKLKDSSSHDDNHRAIITFKGKTKTLDCKKVACNVFEEKRNYQTIGVPSHISITSEQPQIFMCMICKTTFKTRTHIKYHQYCAGGTKPLKCNVCNKEFVLKSHLKVHILNHVNRKSYGCETCGKFFAQRAKLKRHALLHNDTRPFVCQKCGSSFRTKDTLKTHSYKHTGEKPFPCKQCDAKFNNSSNLKKHLVTHSDEQGHMCDVCGKKFKLRSTLRVHQRTHLNLRPHKCTSCSKTFVNSKDLQRHNLIHLDEKAYTCCICNTGFRRKDNLDRHMRNTHPGKKPLFTSILKQTKITKSLPPTVVDNPNAINVITAASPMCNLSVENVPNTNKGKPVPVINAPLKLAFKTLAFKNSYNIHRDYVEPSDDKDVNIYEKIFLPHQNLSKKTTDLSELDSINFQLPPPKPTNYDECERAVIKNIKFKLPSKYVGMTTNGGERTYTELKPPPQPTNRIDNTTTSVIVNAPPPPPQLTELHWRKRTSQTFNLYQHFENA